MKTIEHISKDIAEKTSYDIDTVIHHTDRIARKFNYRIGRGGRLDNQDAKDITFITTRFLMERKRLESQKGTATGLLPMIAQKGTQRVYEGIENVPDHTKPLPIIDQAKRKLFRKKA